ncbi:hypothetical protein, partial [Azospirillum baldaniorum]|uniref:hypothetical protein n=1 Tax=Azospirillum baldaniorum TaxID=1064539 RepID=UPI001B3BDE15
MEGEAIAPSLTLPRFAGEGASFPSPPPRRGGGAVSLSKFRAHEKKADIASRLLLGKTKKKQDLRKMEVKRTEQKSLDECDT